jgi:UDP-N-acetylmuramate: L-alanyl-gamma-D-glutamyl-meso-diaminopimelate ligase
MIACFDYAAVKELVSASKVPVISYGTSASSGARFVPADLRVDAEGMTSFKILDGGKDVGTLRISIPGIHNVLNALSAWIECRELGLTHSEIAEGLAAFRGVKRRQEERGEISKVLVIDDFAHHPTAVRETLRALRTKYPGRRLISVFEPRSATSRRKVFQKDYGDAFLEADVCFISAPYDQSKIASDDQFSSEQLVEDVIRLGRKAASFREIDEGVKSVTESSKPGDLIAVLSNGGFGGFIPKLLESLKLRENSRNPSKSL